MSQEMIQRVRDLVGDVKICMLTTMTGDGKHVSRPMAVQKTDFDGDLWFFTYEGSNKVEQVRLTSATNVAFSDDKSGVWMSVAGNAEVVEDRSKAEELWSPLLKAWFPDGLDTEGLALLKVNAQSAEIWDNPRSRVATAISLVKSAVTGKSAAGEVGDNRSGDL
jgi:general stress protein 26